jgi:hypothetical protein
MAGEASKFGFEAEIAGQMDELLARPNTDRGPDDHCAVCAEAVIAPIFRSVARITKSPGAFACRFPSFRWA